MYNGLDAAFVIFYALEVAAKILAAGRLKCAPDLPCTLALLRALRLHAPARMSSTPMR